MAALDRCRGSTCYIRKEGRGVWGIAGEQPRAGKGGGRGVGGGRGALFAYPSSQGCDGSRRIRRGRSAGRSPPCERRCLLPLLGYGFSSFGYGSPGLGRGSSVSKFTRVVIQVGDHAVWGSSRAGSVRFGVHACWGLSSFGFMPVGIILFRVWLGSCRFVQVAIFKYEVWPIIMASLGDKAAMLMGCRVTVLTGSMPRVAV